MHRLLNLGFSFDWDRAAMNPDVTTGTYTLGEPSFMASYDIEMITLILSTLLFFFSLIKHFRIRNLTKISRQDFLNYIRLIDPPEEEEDSDGEDEELK